MIKVEQIGRECLLAAMCALAGKDYKRERLKYQPWTEHLDYKTTVFYEACADLAPEVGEFLRTWDWGLTEMLNTPLPNEACDFSGKGIIAIAQLGFLGGFLSAHALAFENWQILDPAVGRIYDWLDFAKNYPVNWYAFAIIHTK